MSVDSGTLLELLDNSSIDSRNKNIVSDCPFCGRHQKFGISIVKDGHPWQCLAAACGERGKIYKLLGHLDRLDLVGPVRVDLTKKLEKIIEEVEHEEIDIELDSMELPPGYKRVAHDKYLDSRGFNDDDYFYFEVGRSDNFKFKDYVVFPVKMNKVVVGYVSRHTWSKKRIDKHNDKVKKAGEGYRILRYRNADMDSARMLYNYDRIIEGVTHTVIIVEGIFDVINITRQLDLYDRSDIVVCACFGSKLSKEQIYLLQLKGVINLTLFYDEDAAEKVKYFAPIANRYFDVLVAYNPDPESDAGDLGREEILECLDMAQTPFSFKRNIISKII
jgi:DNA primase